MCNRTRLIVTELCDNIIKTRIIIGEHANSPHDVHIPRIMLKTSKDLGFTMQRHQFPVKTAFAMTIHMSQGQTFEYVGIDLTTYVFNHG
uniref:Uncharacterized protein n=1 Tax=Acrobeloides nanus TaxID=290746 RepID=A0A914DEB8_9BILA